MATNFEWFKLREDVPMFDYRGIALGENVVTDDVAITFGDGDGGVVIQGSLNEMRTFAQSILVWLDMFPTSDTLPPHECIPVTRDKEE